MFDHDEAATRGIMAARGLYTFSHSDAFGSAPAHTLVSRITAEPTGLGVPRSFGDYKIPVDDHDLPRQASPSNSSQADGFRIVVA